VTEASTALYVGSGLAASAALLVWVASSPIAQRMPRAARDAAVAAISFLFVAGALVLALSLFG
jgi:hypothetical protein